MSPPPLDTDVLAATIRKMVEAATLDLPAALTAICDVFARATDSDRGEFVGGDLPAIEPMETGVAEVAVVGLPLAGRPECSLRLVRSPERPYRPEELARAEVLAAAAAAALDGALLRDEFRRGGADLAGVNALGTLISAPHELQQVLAAGVDRVARMASAPYASLLLLDDSGILLRATAMHVEREHAREVAVPLDSGTVVGRALRGARPLQAEEGVPGLREPPLSPTSRVLAAPLIHRGAGIGVLVLARPMSAPAFSEHDVERTVAVSNQLAGAIGYARLLEGERGQVQSLSLLSDVARAVAATLDRDVLLSECLSRICRVLEFESGAASILENADGEPTYVPVADFPRGSSALRPPGLVERAALRAAPVSEQHEDADGTLHACAVPLIAAREVVGVLALGRRGRAITDAELSTLGAIGPEIAVGLEHCRLFSEAQRRVRELGLLLDVARAVTASLDLDRILETSAGILTRMIDASTSFILLLDDERATLQGAACSNAAYRDQFRSVRIPLDATSLSARCVRDRSTIVVRDAVASAEVNKALVDLYGEKSLLALPLLVRGEPIGAVVVDDVREVRDWTGTEIERAELVAHQIAVAVANARLFEDLKQSYVDLARAQENLVQRERLAALGELAAVMAHEVRNPLGVIFNSLATLQKSIHPDAGDARMLLGIVREEADRLNHLVHDLLEFARPRKPALQNESLAAVVEGAAVAARSEPVAPDVHIETHVAPNLPPVRIDARMVRRAIVNLVVNGLQAMARTGGTVTIRADVEDTAERRVARIDVGDTGPGIAPEAASRMFQPFFTTKATGTGLGLAVVKSIVDAHDGTLEVASGPGSGTTFTLRLPLGPAPLQAAAEGAASA